MLVYKTVNICDGNLKDRFVSENKINEMAKDGWKLINITVPPVAVNNKWVSGVFVKDVHEDEQAKRGPGRPPKVEGATS